MLGTARVTFVCCVFTLYFSLLLYGWLDDKTEFGWRQPLPARATFFDQLQLTSHLIHF